MQENLITPELEQTRKPIINQLYNKKWTKITLLLTSLFILGIPLGIYSLSLTHRQLPNKQIAANQAKNNYVIRSTKVANSLMVPPLYPNATWVNKKNFTKSEKFNQAMFFGENTIYIPFTKGEYWVASLNGSNYQTVQAYYEKELRKEGWGFDGNSSNSVLSFKNFNITGIIADGSCGGTVGFVGYKGEMVRLVTVTRKLSPCGPPSLSPTPTDYSTEYTVFISDPTSINEIAAFINRERTK